MISLTIPLRTVSEANSHTHWRERQKRAKGQRSVAELVIRAELHRLGLGIESMISWSPIVVRLTRLAKGTLDDDNLPSSQKHVRDGVADALNLLNDRDPRVTWTYAQERAKTYGVRIEIRRAT